MELSHITRALQEKAIEVIRQADGQMPNEYHIVTHQQGEPFKPYAASFMLETYGDTGKQTFVVTVAKVGGL